MTLKNHKKIVLLILLGIGITWFGVISVALLGMGNSMVGGLVSLGVSVVFAILFIAVLYDKANFSWKAITDYDI